MCNFNHFISTNLHTYIDHNAPCLPPLPPPPPEKKNNNNVHNHWLQYPGEIGSNGYAYILGGNEVHYSLYENGELILERNTL